MYKTLPKELKLSTLKELFGIISHILKRGYIDSFGVVKGESKHKAYLPIYTIKNKLIVDFFANRVMDFDEVYNAFGYKKEDLLYDIDSDNNLHFKTNSDEFKTILLYSKDGVVFPLYDNPHKFRDSKDKITLNIEEFANSIASTYVYTEGQYIISREAVPKPKKIIFGEHWISDRVQIMDSDTDNYIYYTTKLCYDNIDLLVASVCYGLE